MADLADILDPASIFSKHKLPAEKDSLFDVEKFDEKAGRTKLNERLDRAAGQLDGSRGKQGGVDYEVGHHDVVRFKPTLNGQRIFIEAEGEPYFPVDSATFAQFITDLKKLVDAGHYDAQIEAALKSERTSKPVKTSTPRGASKGTGTRRGEGLGNKAQPDNPEWMAKFRAKYGEPDASIVDPVPNTKGDRWIAKKVRDRGIAAAKSRGK